jgi:malate dehydrogenase (oxaloacetate-decarboxylating)
MFNETYKKAAELHKQLGGKLEVKTKVPLLSKEELSLIYTPGVAAVCQEIFNDASKAKTYTIKKNTVAVITDGSAVLGMGNLGALAALPVMEGKCALLKEFAGIDAFPICLDTQDIEAIIGTIKNISPVFGAILLEDISAPRCFEIEERLKKELDIPVMHDDQHGTAVVVLAGLINSMKLKKVSKEEIKIVINGAGAAGTAITKLLHEYGFKNLVVCDSKGSISKHRKDLNNNKQELANICNCEIEGDLESALKAADVFIGVSVKNILTPEMVRGMNQQSIIFALSNPEPEIEPKTAKEAGAFIVATGRSDFPNQINNLLSFPGIFRGLLDSEKNNLTNTMLIKAAENLAGYVRNLSVNNILPDPLDRGVVKIIASAILSS